MQATTSRLAVGTGNKCKLAAVGVIHEQMSDLLSNYIISSHKVDSGIKDQPDTLEETITGAQNRAKGAYKEAKDETGADSIIVGLGIESGLFYTADGRCYDVCVCSSTNDGVQFNQGMSCSFEVPPAVAKFVKEDGMDLTQASNAAGLSANPKLGEAEGLIGVLSQGRITRQVYTEQAVSTSLMWMSNEELYRRE